MPAHPIIVMGASAGGIEALRELLGGLPLDFSGSIFLVVHTSPQSPGQLPNVLGRDCLVPVTSARDNEEIRPAHIYVASPDRHLLIERGRMCLGRGPTENRHRPAIDPLFRSAAAAYGAAVIGVLLSGYLDDGVAGLVAIKRQGGIVIVQSPADALVPDMPTAALENDHVDHSLPVREIPALLLRLASGAKNLKRMNMPRGNKKPAAEHVSVFTCPECHGSLWEADDHGLLQFRCRIGHLFTRESMADAQTQSMDRALWAALRVLEEHAELSRRLAERATRGNHSMAARRFARHAEASRENAKVIREMLTGPVESERHGAHARPRAKTRVSRQKAS